MHFIGFCGAILIGLSLGMIGGGGSILSIPVLVYLFNYSPVDATTYSLFIVGVVSMVGVAAYHRMQAINWKAVFYFGVPSVVTVFIMRRWLLDAIPDTLFRVNTFIVTKSVAILLLFAIFIIYAAIKMILPQPTFSKEKKESYVSIIIAGLLLGLVTGLLGAGGGFLIIPTLILFMGLSIRTAIGSSLMIITINSLIGFAGSLTHSVIHWNFLLPFTGLAIAGVILGTIVSRKISAATLRQAFGWFILANGLFIMIKELFFAK